MRKRLSAKPIQDAKLRFWSYTVTGPTNKCWEYRGDVDDVGYGRVTIAGKKMRTHRFSYMIHHDLTPEDMNGIVIRHTCDNRACVNPSHLLPGTITDNHKDMVERGRHTIGERHPGVKLTEHQVLEMRRLFDGHIFNQAQLAEVFNIHPATVHDIVRRKAWKHI